MIDELNLIISSLARAHLDVSYMHQHMVAAITDDERDMLREIATKAQKLLKEVNSAVHSS